MQHIVYFQLLELQLKYHKHSMAVIEKVLPKMKDALGKLHTF